MPTSFQFLNHFQMLPATSVAFDMEQTTPVFKAVRRRQVPARRRVGSKQWHIDQVLLPYIAQNMGTPSSFAIHASTVLQMPVSRQEAYRTIEGNLLTPKTRSPVPSLSVPQERFAFKCTMYMLT